MAGWVGGFGGMETKTNLSQVEVAVEAELGNRHCTERVVDIFLHIQPLTYLSAVVL